MSRVSILLAVSALLAAAILALQVSSMVRVQSDHGTEIATNSSAIGRSAMVLLRPGDSIDFDALREDTELARKRLRGLQERSQSFLARDQSGAE